MDRSEIVFLYDVRDSNPNGDPDENKPRLDEETEINIVTDSRLKRTIRDYLENFIPKNEKEGKKIWVKGELKEGGTERKTREEKLDELWKNFEIKNREEGRQKLLDQFIDLRLFGATIAGKKENIKGEKVFTWIGPVQFGFGRSLHKVEPVFVKGTSALPTEEKKAGGAFTEKWILNYSLICFHGLINENAAKDTGLSENDVNYLLDGIWNGTKNLITGSKFNHMPRFLIRVIYNEGNYHIGDLDKKLLLFDTDGKVIDKDGKDGKEIRYISDVQIDLTELLEILNDNSDKIKEIQLEIDNSTIFKVNSTKSKGKTIFKEFKKSDELKNKIKELKLEK